MSDEAVTLEFLARQLRRVIDDIGALKDEMRVQTAVILRLERDAAHRDERDAAMLNQMRAMVSSISASPIDSPGSTSGCELWKSNRAEKCCRWRL